MQLPNLDEQNCEFLPTVYFYKYHNYNIYTPHTPSWLPTCNKLVLLWQSVDKLLIYHSQYMILQIKLYFLLLKYPVQHNHKQYNHYYCNNTTQHTWWPPDTSTNTAKLVKWVLLHVIVELFISFDTTVTPSVSQPPLQIHC